MNNELVVKIPHRLTQEEAARRIRLGIDQLQARYGQSIAAISTNWSGYRMEGSVSVLSQSISGAIDVEPTEVVIRVKLPMLLAMVKDKILGFVQKNGEKVLQIK